MRKRRRPAGCGAGFSADMEQPVYAQAVQAGLALLLGIGLGIFYDALKAVRLAPGRGRRHPALTVAADVLFCAVLAFALFSFGLGPGEGSLRAFMLACAGCGWGLYALTLSPLALRFFGLVVKWLCKAAAPGLRCLSKLQKIKKFQKNIFPKFRTRFTMIKNRRGPSRRGGISPEGGGRLEECKGRYSYSPDRGGAFAVRAGEPDHDEGGDSSLQSIQGRTPRRGRRA